MAQRKGISPAAQLARTEQLLGSQSLEQARATLAMMQERRKLRRRMDARERREFDRELRRAEKSEEKAKLLQVRNLGLYSPRLTAPNATLTRSQKAALNKAFRQAEALAKGAVFAPYHGQRKPARKEIAKAARQAGGRATSKGVFLPRADREMRVSAGTLRKDPNTGLWEITVKKTFLDKRGHQRTLTEIRPLAGMEALTASQDKLARRFDRVKIDKRTQRIRFQIHGRNVSRRSFRNIAEAMQYAMGYRSGPRAQSTFLESLSFFVVEKERSRWTAPVGWVNSRGRVRALPDYAAEEIRDRIIDRPARVGKRARRRMKN